MAQPQPGGTAAGPSGPRADFGQRFVALLIDVAIFWVVLFIAYQINFFLGAIIGLVQFAYFVYLEGSPSGQTVGKKVMNIRVVDQDTNGSIDYGRAAVRTLMRIVSGCALYIGYLWMLWDPEKQTWHDKVARTNVAPTSAFPVAKWPG